MAPRIRPPAVAGMFYPASAEGLRRSIGQLLSEAARGLADFAGFHGALRALIVPHAGYPYSGSTAAAAYKSLATLGKDIRSAAIFGPAHRVATPGLALSSWEAFATPLGELPVDRAMTQLLLSLPFVHTNDAAHAREHSIEVQLPFLQTVLPGITILPIVVGGARPAEIAEAIEMLWNQEGTLVIVSSDLSHYLPQEEAALIDSATALQIEDLDARLDQEQACGASAINGLLIAARNRRMHARKIDIRTSADTAGDASSVVGYASFGFCEGSHPDER